MWLLTYNYREKLKSSSKCMGDGQLYVEGKHPELHRVLLLLHYKYILEIGCYRVLVEFLVVNLGS